MVRETRHLWVGNLPDNIREDRIREHFKRYGRVQNVKLLGRTESGSTVVATASAGSNSGVCATVAFMDIKSASKAHNAEHVVDERTLTTEYYEPAAIPSAAGAPSAGSSPAGSGYSGSSSSVNSTPAPSSVSRYHLSGGEDSTGSACPIAATAAAPANWRGTNDSASEYCRRGNTPAAYSRYQRNNSNTPYSTPPSNVERTTPHHRWYGSGERGSGGGASASGGGSGSAGTGGSVCGGGGATGGESTPSTPGGGTESGRRRRVSGSGSSRSESSSPEPSDTSRASTPHAPPPLAVHANHRNVSTPSHHHQWSSTASGRPLAICVRNLPTRSTDSSLKDGLYHEYKKHGKVVWVKVVGQNADRYAVVRFKKPSDVEKALEVSQDKLFFGCKISVAPHQSCDEDADSAKPYETDIDEYHPKATRTLFIGNLEKDVTQQQLRDKFKHFGRIIEIDIKKGSGGGAGYAFCQYASISSVVEAIRAIDGEYVGGSRVKLGFGKPVATTCVWVDGLTEHTEKQEAFYEQLEKHGGTAALSGLDRLTGEISSTRYLSSARHEALRYDGMGGSRARASSYGRASSRTPRYPSLVDHFDSADYATERRYRVYEELGSSPQAEDTPFEDRLQSVVVSPHRARRHRRDSSTEDRKHSKERHRSVGGSTVSCVVAGRRSRSGSRGGSGHAGRRRHRRRRDGSGSRAGTPLRDEPDAPPTEPRRAPKERPPLPMSLPLPKFAVQLLRAQPPAPRPAPAPAPAPDSPPRPPSVSSSSGGSAPHSPSLEERIRSLDEKYEKWSGSRALADAPDRTRLRHRLLEVDINEVKPSEVVRSLLAKRSVFDEDSERLECAVRAPSPGGSPRARPAPPMPRVLRYPFPTHPHPAPPAPPPAPPQLPPAAHSESDADAADRPADPRLNRPERVTPLSTDRLIKFGETDPRFESRIRPRTPSTDKSQLDSSDRRSPRTDEPEIDSRGVIERRRRDSFFGTSRCGSEAGVELEPCLGPESTDLDHRIREKSNILVTERRQSIGKSQDSTGEHNISVPAEKVKQSEEKQSEVLAVVSHDESNKPRHPTESLLKRIGSIQDILKNESFVDVRTKSFDDYCIKSELPAHIHEEIKLNLEKEVKEEFQCQAKIESEKSKDIFTQNLVKKELLDLETQQNHLNSHSLGKPSKEMPELSQDFIKNCEKNGKERYNQNIMLEALHITKLEKENIEFEKCFEKHSNNSIFFGESKFLDAEKIIEDRSRNDKVRHGKDRHEKDKHDNDKEKSKSSRHDKTTDKSEKDKRSKEESSSEKTHVEKSEKHRDLEKSHKEKSDRDRDSERSKHSDEKFSRHDHHRKDKLDREKRKDSTDNDTKVKKEDKSTKHEKHEKSRKDSSESAKRDSKKESDSPKLRKSSRDESSRDIYRKDSTDSSTSRASHDSVKSKDLDIYDIKEEAKTKKHCNDIIPKTEIEKELSSKCMDIIKFEPIVRVKIEVKEEKPKPPKVKEEDDRFEHHAKVKSDNSSTDHALKCKGEITEKQRHYSLDSPSVDSKRKERLNSCSSLPSNIGLKRRMSSQDSLDSVNEDLKKVKNEMKYPDRRDSKESRNVDRHKTTKFSKGHFAKIIESKTKDDKKNQVKPPDETFEYKEIEIKPKEEKTCSEKQKLLKKSPAVDEDEKLNSESQIEGLQNDIDFLATLELRSSEEDEKQKALRKEMKERKRIQQLQQIQELQMQQDAMQQSELINKFKDDKKKTDEKKKEAVRDKRLSTDRKSRDEKSDNNSKRKSRRPVPGTDSSDSDEPKKHSIFDIIDDGPTYISMYDKVKARSCKNMQKQEEEKRQEKIKAKFSQLKQCRAKREEKKRSSWDEDSDSENDTKKAHKSSMDSSTDDDMLGHNKKREKVQASSSFEYDRNKNNDYFTMQSNEEDSRNKLSRKNSRTRIISDTSDDEASKRSMSKSPQFMHECKKELTSDPETSRRTKDDSTHIKESCEDKVKKHSLLNLFGKSDSDDSKIKSGLETDNEYKPNFAKSIPNDYSSESESAVCNRNAGEVRKRHKKKQKKHKSLSLSDNENKFDYEMMCQEGDPKHRTLGKIRRHSNKKEKRKDKIRESVDTDEHRDDKNKPKRDKKLTSTNFDSVSENISKKDGKMEDIFGPLSDESDRDTKTNKLDVPSHSFESTYSSNEQMSTMANCDDGKLQDRDDSRRRRERKRKDKRFLFKEDDNSLDVDALSKAIEARLFAESITDDDNRSGIDALPEYIKKIEENEFKLTGDSAVLDNVKGNDRHNDKIRKDCREKKKKKKRNREDRQSRKEYHHFYHSDKVEKAEILDELIEISAKDMLLDIPLPSDTPNETVTEKSDDNKSLTESPSLPSLLIDSSQVLIQTSSETKLKPSNRETPNASPIQVSMEIDYPETKEVEVDDIPMPPPIENIDISEVPLPKDPPIIPQTSQPKNVFGSSFSDDVDNNESAVRGIPNLTNETETPVDKVDTPPAKIDKKSEEKPRAIISQEETEDAVAALLGESFGGKDNSFADCYEQAESTTTSQAEIETTSIETENIPEEDAEEMRQAVQNLNASEMEMKPDTPVSDSDLLLIDTDTEETDDTPQDAIERLPVNIIATNQSLTTVSSEQPKTTQAPNIVTAKPKTTIVQVVTSNANDNITKVSEPEIKIQLAKRDNVKQMTSTATPVITSWTLANNKLIEPHLLNIQANSLHNRDKSENKPTHITANIVQIKAPHSQNMQVNNLLRPIITPSRVSAPYQVINQMIRPQTPNMQPPTIKIPEPHILYQKPSGIVISPRMCNDPRMQSPKTTVQGEGMTSPRLSNMTIFSTASNTMQQRSPGQVTVVRMQQPPLSPIQAMHLPHGARTMLSPNRPNSVLVQTQGPPLHFNRLPVTPVLAPINKQISVNNIVQQNKAIVVSTNSLIHPQKILTEDKRKNDQRMGSDTVNEKKNILSPTSLPSTTNPTVMAQNRLITMQHAVHVGNKNSPIHIPNKVFLNNMNQSNDKRENQVSKAEPINHLPFGTNPIIHVTGIINPSSASIIQSVSKPVMCTLQEANSISRTHGSNVIHTLNSQRLLTTAPMSNVIQIEANKDSPSVLSMANIGPPSVLHRLDSTKSVAATTTCLTNVVMTPLILKPSSSSGAIVLNPKNDTEKGDGNRSPNIPLANHVPRENEMNRDEQEPAALNVTVDKRKDYLQPTVSSVETTNKCETDFEELLKDNTNEIKVTNNPEKKLEINIGKTVTLINTPDRERKQSIDSIKKDGIDKSKPVPEKPTAVMHFPNNSEDLNKIRKDSRLDKEISIVDKTVKIISSKTINTYPKEDTTKSIPVSPLTLISNKVTSEPLKSQEVVNTCKVPDDNFFTSFSKGIDNDIHLKNLDENDSWSATDLNLDSVIKKVDSLCNENNENTEVSDKKEVQVSTDITSGSSLNLSNASSVDSLTIENNEKPMDIQGETVVGTTEQSQPDVTSNLGKSGLSAKRGARSARGKRSDKNSDRVQTRQISKPTRGGNARRGRGGRAKVDKKIKNMVNSITNNLPGDVYDFHEDSGDETTSPNKAEARPRLILTIKSPLSGHCATSTSTLSITPNTTPKDEIKTAEKNNKEEKPEDFISPSANTRKSRRLQAKDVQKTTVDDTIDDFVTSPTAQTKSGKRKPARNTGAKAGLPDTRKSPRGVKRTRDRSLSDASIDSGDEKVLRPATEQISREPKAPRLAEVVVPATSQPETPSLAPKPQPTPVPVVVQQPTPITCSVLPSLPTPIMKPPKKMISEISAKLAGAFENATVRGAAPAPVTQIQQTLFGQQPSERAADGPADKTAQAAPAADADFRPDPVAEAYARRALVDNVPGNMMPVGATEATDARVQSPALPHRPPSSHRLADRATPVLLRGGESEGAIGAANPPGLGHVNIGGGPGPGLLLAGPRFRGAYTGAASLPRGAHHPQLPMLHAHHAPHAPHSPHSPHAPHAPHPHPSAHVKQVAVIGPHHHNHPTATSRVTLTSVPAISPQGTVGLGEGMYPHFSHQHYQVYQKHFHATQHESIRTTPSPYTRTLEEGCEAATPPLELRRGPPARVPRPAHSPAPAPADRLIMYAVGCGRSPPPAHGTSRMPGALPPSAAPGPPHASQVPREADSLQMLLRRYPVMWQGLLALKNDSAAVQMHFVGGNPGVAGSTLPRHADGSTPLLRIAQRMRLEPAQLDQVHRKMKLESEHCMLLALPCGRDHMDVLQQSTNLTGGFITYLQCKQAAGIVNVAPPGHHQALYTVHIFPSCDFANENLNRIAPDLMHRVADIAHLLIVIATV